MPSPSKKSHGQDVQARVKSLLKALLDCVAGGQELGRGVELKWAWSDDEKVLTIETTLRSLVLLSQPTLNANTQEFKLAKSKAGEALNDLRDFVAILEDHRVQKKGSDKWRFSLRLWGKDVDLNLAEFDKLWESKRSPASKPKPAPASQPKSPLKAGAPFPRVRLPENFVERPDALNAVKAKLLAVDERTLVVSAIAGLGGLGKSVLAAALVQDLEVQARFTDGILWVTLGQSPDLQTLLGDWIRELDKSREAFSANTLESASRYLDSLLAERQMLLVVDDVWNAAHAEWFRVGGEGCRVLVTTREAQIEGADTYSLALMSEPEAIALVRQKLGNKWRSAQEVEVKAFAKLLGYLPLALDLATNQVRDGLSWEELRSEFEAERRSVASGIGRRSRALNLLDSSEKWDNLDENAQRKYSLQACFNLSLKRLNQEQLQQFAWLGVLPEDVNLNSRMAEMLWDLNPLQAKKVLIMLRNRSFLTDGVTTITEEQTYRVHDLMHDMARSLIEEGILSAEPVPPLELAHRQFLERYRERASNHRWDGLPNDGYIHRHLTWHLEQANWGDELHALMSMSDAKGRNAWFEACDRLGQPAIFVDDVARGWKIAERGYEGDRAGAIVLQCRYALITATLNSLVENLPIGMMAEFVKHGFWTVEQAWAYVEQMQDEYKIAEAIQVLATYLSKSLLQEALQAAREIKDESSRARVLSELAKVDSAYFEEALQAAREIKAERSRARVLSELAKIDSAYFEEALQATRKIENEYIRANVLSELTKIDSAYFEEALQAVREIKSEEHRTQVLSKLANINSAYFDFDMLLSAAGEIKSEYSRARVLLLLARIDSAYFEEALQATRKIENEYIRADVLLSLARIDSAYCEEALQTARELESEYSRADVLSELARIDSAYFEEALQVAREIKDKDRRQKVLSKLANIDATYFEEALQVAREIDFEYSRASVLSELAKIDSAYFDLLLEAAREIKDEEILANVLLSLAKIDSAYFEEALQAAREIESEYIRVMVLSELAKIDSAYFEEALQATREIESEYIRAEILIELAKIDSASFDLLLEAAREIKDEDSRASVLSELAKIDSAYFEEALQVARKIEIEYSRVRVLSALAKIDSASFDLLLEAARDIKNVDSRAEVLSALAKIDSAYFEEALQAAKEIESEYIRVRVLSELAKIDSAYFDLLLKVARDIKNVDSRAEVLSTLAKIDSAYFEEALQAAREIKDNNSQPRVLSALAKIDSAFFNATLQAARKIEPEYVRAEALSELAKIDSAFFDLLLEAAREIKYEESQASVLIVMAKQSPQHFLSNIYEAILTIVHNPSRAEAISGYITRLSLATLPYSEWQTHLHILAHRKRSDLMQDLVTLYSAILHLGGTAAVRGVIDTMRQVCSQWK
ncbi:NB-ARC domain-containing protein [Pseudanabaena minima]|uniref:NB-ARC domain-containing protein n=1 Tax=Pseudanabaena minima TaxID=890415 RepID=UPI003DA98716